MQFLLVFIATHTENITAELIDLWVEIYHTFCQCLEVMFSLCIFKKKVTKFLYLLSESG